ncbi:MAG: ABC transporter permease [Methylococcaceae bacterium]|nr:ABC transporter permease [Methylococcaceae bacterium]
MPQLLPTDILFFLMLLGLAALAGYTLRQEHLRRPWRKVAKSRSAMISLVILLSYLLIAVLDSIRLPVSPTGNANGNGTPIGEPVTLLDQALGDIRDSQEKTYSAPLAVYAHAKEMLRQPDGQESWAYPRLRFGGRQLTSPETEHGRDIGQRTGRGLVRGLTVWVWLMGLWVVAASIRRKRLPAVMMPLLRGETALPWRAIALTVLVICLLSGVMVELSRGYHVLGTGKVGEDVLYQSLKSIRTGVLIGTLTTVATLPLALVLGILAGYYRGWVDDVIQYLYTTLNSVPGVLLIAAAMLVMQSYMARHEAEFASLATRADFRLLALCLILGLTSWTGLCRLLRAETLKLRELEYVQAARVLGVSQGMILLRHILPNLFHLVLISVALDFSSLVLAEAVLSYVNIGVDPSTESWGNMINSARLEMAREPVVWWSLAAAFAFMFALVLPANLFADAVRDAFDPRRAE